MIRLDRNQVHHIIWASCDALFLSVSRIRPLPLGESHLFHVVQHRYLGRPFFVDEIQVRPFDTVIELHMNNKALTDAVREEDSIFGLASRLIRETRRSLPAIADCVASPEYSKSNVLYGTTLIHRGVERFGFTTRPLQNRLTCKFLTWYLRNIFRMANPAAHTLLQSRPELFMPKIVAISKRRLLEKYGQHSTAPNS